MMSELLDIVKKLEETEAIISKTENMLIGSNLTTSMAFGLESLKKRQENLNIQVEHASQHKHLNVCKYRLFYETTVSERPNLRAFAKTLLDFQNLFSLVYYAIKSNQPRQRQSVSAEIAQETAFGLNYTFTGSLGAVLTLPNERLLFGDTMIDESVKLVFELIKLKDT